MRARRVRPDPGLLLAGAAAVVLLPLMFTSWFCLSSAPPAAVGAVTISSERCFDAWTSFAAIDLVLAFTAIATIAITVLVLLRVELPLLPGPILTVIGGFSFLLVLMRLIAPPWAGASRAAGPFLALLCLAVLTAGGVLSARIQARFGKQGRRPAAGSRPDGKHRSGRRPATAGAGRPGTGFRDFNGRGGTG